jgi:inorganic pyrophosphatase
MILKSKECVLIECCSLYDVSSRLWFYSRDLALDGDPLDVLVLVNEPTFRVCYGSKTDWCFHMADDKGPDEKVMCQFLILFGIH